MYNKNPIISIIIPIYNVEKVLHRCLDSVINQTFHDFECILADDCSPDNCSNICDEYVQKDGRFIVIHKSINEGLPKARKSGLDIAKGVFIFHLDSDDWVENNALELLYKKQQETNSDIVVGRYKNIYKKYENVAISRFENKFHNNLVDLFMNNNVKRVWGKLYRKTLFDNYIVPPMNTGEDFFVNIQIFFKFKYLKLININNVIYNYDRTNGITSIKKEKKYNNMEDFEMYKIRKIIKEYLSELLLENSEINNAFLYDLLVGAVIPYIRSNKDISYKEIKYFYNNYYLKCKFKNYISLYKKISFLYLFYFGKIKLSILFHFYIINMARNIKYKLIS